MRAAAMMALLVLSACVADKLAVNPPAGVDLSGRWTLDEADSDDPQHLAQAANGTATTTNDIPQSARGRGRGGGAASAGFQGPSPPPVSSMAASLRWPGKGLEIKQVAGVVAFTSDGRNRVCEPGADRRRPHRDDSRDRDSMPSERDPPPQVCGWSEGTLVMKGGGDSDEDRARYEEHYDLSDDRKRLIEVVVFTGGRSSGYTLSRVWDRVPK